ncbi:inositol phospholipid synthesis and fat-storage-inducing TM-domain-containing protein [Amylocystis lapponica]|nr:inositol phospholipid synthesis and fat-storage-inducing TM-domain-containing protein [Amylocystis lapponica]
MPDARHAALAAITSIVLFGTIYSVNHNTYLDTSNPLLSHLPHPLHHSHYFASKANLLNVLFIKRAWGWTSAAFLFLFSTGPPLTRTKERVAQYLAATAIWLIFTTWFFGPPVLERLISSTGGECVLALPSGAVLTVPTDFCYAKTVLSPATHPALFATSLLLPDADWHARPRLRRGHDVSGHIFLLTLSALFLVDQLRPSFSPHAHPRWSPLHRRAVLATAAVLALLLFATYTTSVYFHTPVEKLSGYLLGVGAFAITQLPGFRPAPQAAVITNKPVREAAHERT